MVYTIFYYAGLVFSKIIVYIVLKLLKIKSRFISEKKREEREKPAPTWGWFESRSPLGSEIVWVGKATNLNVTIPHVAPTTKPVTTHTGKPPARLYFTFTEAASKEWFKEIEELAKIAEEREKGGE